MLRVAVVGAGSMGLNHIRVYSELPECSLVAVVDEDKARLNQIERQYQVNTYTNYRDLLPNKVDAVSIVTPTSTHYDIAKDFLRNDISVLLEKPIAKTLEEATGLVEEAENSDAIAMVGHIERFNPVIRETKKILESGILGRVISCSVKRVGPYMARIMDVGVVMDICVHDIDLVQYLFNSPKINNISAYGGSVKHTEEDYAFITMTEDGAGTIFNIEANWLTPYKQRRIIIVGSDGLLEGDLIDKTLKVYKSDRTIVYKVDNTEPLKSEIVSFLGSIVTASQPAIDFSSGREVIRLAHKVLKLMV